MEEKRRNAPNFEAGRWNFTEIIQAGTKTVSTTEGLNDDDMSKSIAPFRTEAALCVDSAWRFS